MKTRFPRYVYPEIDCGSEDVNDSSLPDATDSPNVAQVKLEDQPDARTNPDPKPHSPKSQKPTPHSTQSLFDGMDSDAEDVREVTKQVEKKVEVRHAEITWNPPSTEEIDRKLRELQDLRDCMARDANIEYKNPSQFVFSDGSIESPVMLIGEAPGEDEVTQGKPFVGKSGRLLQEMLDAAGIVRSSIYITNVVVWRPPMNRTPLPAEITEMAQYALRHIEIIKPKILVLIGGVSYRCVMQEAIAISKVRGIWHARYFCPAIINIFHPSYLLRSPVNKRETWADILSIREKMIAVGVKLGGGVLNVS